MASRSFGRYSFETSNEDKILFPESKITKGRIIDYYSAVAEYMVPLIKDRPLTLKRYPNGIGESGFFQKNASDYFPDWIERTDVARSGLEDIQMVLGNNAATLAYLANQGTITIHSWLSRKDDHLHPDRVIFDLDPSTKDFGNVKTAAREMKTFLEEELRLNTFLMTTGSKGLHIVVPVKREFDYDLVKDFARKVGDILSHRHPEKYTIEHRKKKRGHRLFIDYLRNEYAQTGVAPYSIRAREGAPVATPVFWEELDGKKFHSNMYNIKNVIEKVKKDGNPWENINRSSKSLEKAMEIVEEEVLHFH